jgi:hypothetical protein
MGGFELRDDAERPHAIALRLIGAPALDEVVPGRPSRIGNRLRIQLHRAVEFGEPAFVALREQRLTKGEAGVLFLLHQAVQ